MSMEVRLVHSVKKLLGSVVMFVNTVMLEVWGGSWLL